MGDYQQSQKEYNYTDNLVAQKTFLDGQTIGVIETYFEKLETYSPENIEYIASAYGGNQASYEKVVSAFD
jgi:hypothetical protein